MNKNLLILTSFLGMIFYSCSKCELGKANYYIPQYIPFFNQPLILKIEDKPYFAPNYPYYFLPGTGITFNSGSRNEFFSVERINPNTNQKNVIYWTSDSPPFSTNSTNKLFLPLRIDEVISIYNCVFIVSDNISCFFEDARPKSKSKIIGKVKLVNGQPVKDTESIYDNDINKNNLITYGYYLSVTQAKIKGSGIYEFEIIANPEQNIPEDNFVDNKYITTPQKL